MGFEDATTWMAIGTAATASAAAFRPIGNIIIFFLAVRDAKPDERSKIIDSLAKTRQFGLWSKPQWSQRKRTRKPPQGPPGIERIQTQPADEEAA